MLNDLINNHKLKGLTYRQLTELLGQPKQNMKDDSNAVYYNIIADFGHDIDPIYSKTLVIKLRNDSIVADYRIDETKK